MGEVGGRREGPTGWGCRLAGGEGRVSVRPAWRRKRRASVDEPIVGRAREGEVRVRVRVDRDGRTADRLLWSLSCSWLLRRAPTSPTVTASVTRPSVVTAHLAARAPPTSAARAQPCAPDPIPSSNPFPFPPPSPCSPSRPKQCSVPSPLPPVLLVLADTSPLLLSPTHGHLSPTDCAARPPTALPSTRAPG